MKLGVRGKLFLSSLALILSAALISGFYLEHQLESWLRARLETELLGFCKIARQTIELDPDPLTIENMDALADRLGAATSARVTIILDDGKVIGDSDLSPREVEKVENHRDRPEIRRARDAGFGSELRYSRTLSEHMLYVAVPFRRSDAAGFVREAMPLVGIRTLTQKLRMFQIFSGLIGLVVALAISALASHYVSRSFRRLVASARAAAEGKERRRIDVASTDELGGLAGSINQMTEELESLVSTLAGERDRFGAILEAMTDAVIALDGGQRITLVNRSAMDLLSLSEQPLNRSLIEVIRAPALQDLLTLLKQNGASAGEIDLPGEKTRRILVRAAPLRATGGSVIVMSDITELRRLETVRKDFVANVSHELRTPVSVIRANSETLLSGALDEPDRARTFVDAVYRNAERLTNLLADLLDLSRIESGGLALDLKRLEIEPVIRRVLDIFEKSAREKEHVIVSEIEPGLSARADAKALEQVLSNLLDNAVKYTQRGGRISVRAAASGAEVRIEVADDGPGIELRHRERIFERFYRVDPSRSREMGGTGLGLSIVKHLVEVMGGRVAMTPADPHGAVFRVSLPAA